MLVAYRAKCLFIYYPDLFLFDFNGVNCDEKSSMVQIDIFMDVTFQAVRIVSRSLLMKLSGQHTGFCITSDLTAEQTINYLC